MSTTTTPVEENGAPADPMHTLPAVLGANPWRKSAPARVRKDEVGIDGSKPWQAWRELLQERTADIALWKREHASPLRWGLEGVQAELSLLDEIYDYASARKRDAAKSSAKKSKAHGKSRPKGKLPRAFAADQVVRAWLTESEGAPMTAVLAVESLAWCYALPRLAQDVSAELWWELTGRLLETVAETQKEDPQSSPSAYQMLAVEAALVLGAVADELRICRAVAKASRASLISVFDQLLDGEGTPHRDYLADLRAMAASWLRCQRLLDHNEKLATKQVRKALREFDEVVLAIARLSRLDGSQHFGPLRAVTKTAPKTKSRKSRLAEADAWLQHLSEATEDPDVGTALRIALGTAARKADAEKADDAFDVGHNSEWSELAVLRSSWRQYSPRMAVDYGSPTTQLELSAGMQELLAGPLTTELHVDGEPVPMTSSWTCVCWQSDSDCDYLELETQPAPGLVLQRSIMLAHEDCFAWIADSVAWGREHTVDYQLSLPFASGVNFKASSEHTEVDLLAKKKSVARVMPLNVSEWSSATRNGKLIAEDNQLRLQQQQHGWGLYAGVFIDLEPPRLARQFTWRQLTVAEERQILSPDLAVAQRVQCGNKHWIFYRSIGARGNRTFLGINVSTELLAARFDTDGEYETLVEVL